MSRVPLPAIVTLGLLLLAPTLFMGFHADDYLHQLVLRGEEEHVPMEPWSLFDFGTLASWSELDGRVGAFPWWTGEGWHVRFLRPVASLLLWGQHALFANHAFFYHLVGLVLFSVLLVSAHGLYRDLGLSRDAAKRATLLLALCDSVALPVGWPANQSSLLVALLAVASLRLVIGGDPGPRHVAVSLAASSLAALSKEAGCVSFLLVAVVLALRARRTPDDRARRIAVMGASAAVLLFLAYAVFLLAGGYGTASLFYATPWSDPLRFGRNLLVLGTAGIVSLVGPFPLDVAALFPRTWGIVVLVGALVGLPLAVRVARRVRATPGSGLLAAWTALFGIVQAGAPPSDRLLFVSAIGGLGLLALHFEVSRERRRHGADGRAARLVTTALWLSATVGSGVFLFVQGAGLSLSARYLRARAVETDVGPPKLGHRDVFLLQTESQMQAFTLHTIWAHERDDHDLTFRNLQAAGRPVRWTRTAEDAFTLETLDEPFLTRIFEQVYLTGPPRFAAGTRWRTAAFEVEALAVQDGAPTRLAFRLERSLDDPAVRFVRPVDGRLTRIDPPAVGASIELARPERVGPYVP